MTSKTLVDAGFSSVEVLIEQLLGTCQDFSEVGVDFYDLDKEEVECIDDAMFNCASCGWWFDLTDSLTETLKKWYVLTAKTITIFKRYARVLQLAERARLERV